LDGPLRIAAVQMGVHQASREQGIKEAEALVREAARQGARLVCLPEHWLASHVIEPSGELYKAFSELAAELGLYINLGGLYEAGNPVRFVSPTLSPKGTLIGRQAKVHLYGRERELAAPGSGYELLEVDGIRAGVLVCHDVVFPESARALALKGAELLLVPSLIVRRGTEPWHIYVMARALENRVPVVAPNAYAPPLFIGRSIIVDLYYDEQEGVMLLKKHVMPDGKGILLAEVNPAALRHLRQERLGERRPEAYDA